jgi:hypothetical protein
MSGNSTKDYNDFIRANLPEGMSYNGDVDRYQVNDRSFFTYKKSDWYYRYISKFGYLPIPAILFANGEQGAWYDPSDLSTLFQDSAGTTPVTTAGQPVGLMLDKSQGLTLGPELVTNGTFDSDLTGWTSVDGGAKTQDSGAAVINITSGAGSFAGGIRQTLSIQAGKAYEVKADLTKSGGTGKIRLLFDGAEYPYGGVSVNGSESISRIIVASSTSIVVELNALAGGGANNVIGRFDNISVKLLPGNHATQATSAARPTYQYVWDGVGPLGDELVTNGDFATDSDWNKNSSWTISGGVATLTTPTGNISLTQAVTPAAGSVYKVVFTLLGRTAGDLFIRLGGNTNLAGTFTTNTTHTFYVTAENTNALLSFIPTANFDGSIDNVSVKEIPVGSRLHYLAFDGVDDAMATGTITPGVDKAQVFAGVRKLSSSTYQCVVEHGTDSSAIAGTMGLWVNWDAAGRYTHNLKGTGTASRYSSTTFSAPTSNTTTSLFDLAAGSLAAAIVPRVDGALERDNPQGGAPGTTNFINAPLYLGARTGTAFKFNGNMYGLIVRFGANLSDAQIASTEAYAAAKTGVTL